MLAKVIPPLNEQGWLAEGVYDATLEEVANRFGLFQGSERRPHLWTRFTEFVHQIGDCDFVETVLLDGSFVTGKPDPSDIDLVAIVAASYDFSQELSPTQYAIVSHRRVRSRFGFDIVVVKNDSANLEQAAFFQQVKQRPNERKGIVRVRL